MGSENLRQGKLTTVFSASSNSAAPSFETPASVKSSTPVSSVFKLRKRSDQESVRVSKSQLEHSNQQRHSNLIALSAAKKPEVGTTQDCPVHIEDSDEEGDLQKGSIW